MIPILHCPKRDLGELTADADSPTWSEVPSVPLLDAVTGATPKQGTTVRALWNSNEWRLLFVAADTLPWATMRQHDAPLYEEEVVEVFFDPAGDLKGYFEIEVNPLGAILDLVLRKNRSGYRGDESWHCAGLRRMVRVHAGAWSTELSIPFASVTNAPPAAGARWRANFYRIDRPACDGSIPRELTAWSPPTRPNFHTPEKFGIVEFVD